MKRIRKQRMQETVELNITAFLNLMVILVPFLLITAVFSRMTVLELNLPALEAQQKENEEIKLQLQVLINEDKLVVQDAILGPLKEVVRDEQGDFKWKILTDVLLEIKTRFPQEQNISLLMDTGVRYKTMINVMDHVRYAEVVQTAAVELVELFPNVSIGDAPAQVSEQAGEGEAGE